MGSASKPADWRVCSTARQRMRDGLASDRPMATVLSPRKASIETACSRNPSPQLPRLAAARPAREAMDHQSRGR